MISKKFKHIIFDLGGVILDLNYQNTIDAFVKLGVANFEALYSQAKQNNQFDLFETGKIDELTFVKYIQSLIDVELSHQSIVDAWNAMLGPIQPAKRKALKQLSEKFNLVLLSNTNETHLRCFKQDIISDYNEYWFPEVFQEVYYSHEIGLRKPNKEVFEFVLEQNNFKVEDTIFFDDSIQHIEGAQSVGIDSFLISKEKPFENYLSEFLS